MTQMPATMWMDKEAVVRPHSRTQVSNEKNGPGIHATPWMNLRTTTCGTKQEHACVIHWPEDPGKYRPVSADGQGSGCRLSLGGGAAGGIQAPRTPLGVTVSWCPTVRFKYGRLSHVDYTAVESWLWLTWTEYITQRLPQLCRSGHRGKPEPVCLSVCRSPLRFRCRGPRCC